MAAKYDIDFPLLSDPDLKLAKIYSGISGNSSDRTVAKLASGIAPRGFPLPAVYILRQGGGVFFRKIGDTKDDRPDAAQLLALVDKMTGTSGLPGTQGFAPSNQLRLGVAFGGHQVQGERSFASDLQLDLLRNIGAHFALGFGLGALTTPERELRAALLVRGRLPYWGGVGELYLQVPLGITRRFADDELSEAGFYHGATVGNSFDISPTIASFFDLTIEDSALRDGDNSLKHSARLMLRMGVGFKF